MWVLSFHQEDSLEKEMTSHSRILAWRIPWTEEPGRLQSMGSQGVRHDLSDCACSMRVLVWHVGSSSPIRDQTQTPYIRSLKSQPLDQREVAGHIDVLYKIYKFILKVLEGNLKIDYFIICRPEGTCAGQQVSVSAWVLCWWLWRVSLRLALHLPFTAICWSNWKL